MGEGIFSDSLGLIIKDLPDINKFKEVNGFTKSNPYIPYLECHDIYRDYCVSLDRWVYVESETIQKEIGNYKIISYYKIAQLVKFRDIFRISDGPDLWIGTCSGPGCYEDDKYRIFYAYPTFLEKYHSSDIWLRPEFDPSLKSGLNTWVGVIEQLTEYSMQMSEVELENALDTAFC